MPDTEPYPVIYVVARCLTPLEDLREADDRHAVGVWEFTPSDRRETRLQPSELVGAALDCYHSQVAIDELDAFTFEVYVDGVLTPQPDDYETYSLQDSGDCDSISDDPDEIAPLIAALSTESPAPEPDFAFKVGDVVCFTNEYGVEWHGRRVVSTVNDAVRGLCYHFEPTDAPWFPNKESLLTHEVLSRAQLDHCLLQDGLLHRFVESNPTYLDDISAVIEARKSAPRPAPESDSASPSP